MQTRVTGQLKLASPNDWDEPSSQNINEDPVLSLYLVELKKVEDAFTKNKTYVTIAVFKEIVKKYFPEQNSVKIFSRDPENNNRNIFHYLAYAEVDSEFKEYFHTLKRMAAKAKKSPFAQALRVSADTIPFGFAIARGNFLYAELITPLLLNTYDDQSIKNAYARLTKICNKSQVLGEMKEKYYFLFLDTLITNIHKDPKAVSTYIADIINKSLCSRLINQSEVERSTRRPFAHKMMELVLSDVCGYESLLKLIERDRLRELENVRDGIGDTPLLSVIYRINNNHPDEIKKIITALWQTLDVTVVNVHGANVFHKTFRNPNTGLIHLILESLIANNVSLTLLKMKDADGNTPIADAIYFAEQLKYQSFQTDNLRRSIRFMIAKYPEIVDEPLDKHNNKLLDFVSQYQWLENLGDNIHSAKKKNVAQDKDREQWRDQPQTPKKGVMASHSAPSSREKKRSSLGSSTTRSQSNRGLGKKHRSLSASQEKAHRAKHTESMHEENILREKYAKKYEDRFKKREEELKQKHQKEIDELNEKLSKEQKRLKAKIKRIREKSKIPQEDSCKIETTLTGIGAEVSVEKNNEDLFAEVLESSLELEDGEILDDPDTTTTVLTSMIAVEGVNREPSISEEPANDVASESAPASMQGVDEINLPEDSSNTENTTIKPGRDKKRKREQIDSDEKEQRNEAGEKVLKKAKTLATVPKRKKAKQVKKDKIVKSSSFAPSWHLPSVQTFSFFKSCGKKYEAAKISQLLPDKQFKQVAILSELTVDVEQTYLRSKANEDQGQWAECYVYLFLISHYAAKYSMGSIQAHIEFLDMFSPKRALTTTKDDNAAPAKNAVKICGENDKKQAREVNIAWFNIDGMNSNKGNRDIDIRRIKKDEEGKEVTKDVYTEIKGHVDGSSEHSCTKNQVKLMLKVGSLTQEKYRLYQVNHVGTDKVTLEIKKPPFNTQEELYKKSTAFKIRFD